jgi:hypothetical protein
VIIHWRQPIHKNIAYLLVPKTCQRKMKVFSGTCTCGRMAIRSVIRPSVPCTNNSGASLPAAGQFSIYIRLQHRLVPTILDLFMAVGDCIPISNENEGLGTSGYSNLKKSDWTSALQPQVPFFLLVWKRRSMWMQCLRYSTVHQLCLCTTSE